MTHHFLPKLATIILKIINSLLILIWLANGLFHGKCYLVHTKIKIKNKDHLTFDNATIEPAASQKHLGLYLDSNEHIDNKIIHFNKIILIIKKLFLAVSRKSFVSNLFRPNLDYAGIIYFKPLNESFQRKIEMVQYNTPLVIFGSIKGISHDTIYL